MHARSALAAALALVSLAGCATAPARVVDTAPPAERLARLERQAEDSKKPEDLGRAGLLTLLVTGDGARAEKLFAQALAHDAGEAWSLYGRMLEARERLDDVAVAKAGVQLLQKAPQSPLAELAATRLLEVAQNSPASDRILLDGLAPLDSGNMGLSGKAALRAREALLSVRDGRNAESDAARVRSSLGMPAAWTVVGPLQALRLRDFSKPSPVESGALQATYTGPLGPVAPRVIPTPSGVLDLEADTWRADLFDALVDLDVQKGGTHLVSLRGTGLATVTVDGVVVLQRRNTPVRAPERSWGAVELPAGKHRLRVHLARSEAAWTSLVIARADGQPDGFTTSAPQIGSSAPQPTAKAAQLREGSLEWARARAENDPGDALVQFVKVQALLADDTEEAREQLSALVASAGETRLVRSLRADLTANDPDLPRANATARIVRDLDAILAKHPDDARAHLLRFEQERGDKRFDEAQARLDTLTKLLGDKHARLQMLRARFALDRGDPSGARRSSEAALAADPGRCDALDFRTDLARRDDEVAVADELMPQLASCPGGLAANAHFLKMRGKLDRAKAMLELLAQRNPANVTAVRSLSDGLFALGDLAGAQRVLEPLVAMWPSRADALRRLAQLRELAGDSAGARTFAQKAVAVEGSDLATQRLLALDSKREVMDWAARDGLAVIDGFKKARVSANAPAVQVLDLGALEVQPDGSSIERVHSIVQVLDKRGIDRFGEVTVPGDAQTLVLRTVKADGTILDAELIGAKESVSLPNLEPGDFVEYEYLRASGPRPASIGGWQGGQFFFQGPDVPFFESSYLVRVPQKLGVEIDAHAMGELPRPEQDGEWLRYTFSRRNSEAFLREPIAVSDGEVMPWVELGAGARQEDALRQLADWVVLRARPTGEVREAVRGLSNLPQPERARQAVARVRELVKGDANPMDFSDSAATIFARGRGNRLLALKAALNAVGVKSHLVVARPFAANQHDFRFPRSEVFGSALLRIEPEGAQPMWMDFGLRLAPLDRVQPALSEASAYLLPEPGEDVQRLTLPKVDPRLDRTDAEMQLALGADGTLTGTVTQTAYGFDAAAMRRRLEQVNETELRKQQERMLSGTFRGVQLVDLKIEDRGDPASPVVAVSTIRVPRFGQRADGTIALPANFGPQQLGPRYLGRAERRTPMLLPANELTVAKVRLALPAGAKVQAPGSVELKSDFGTFRAKWTLDGGTLALDEETLLLRGRIAPEQYKAFKGFAAQVDAAQAREIPLALK